jgi:outer membrane protein OmpA-like peptidoglycan-associated protein
MNRTGALGSMLALACLFASSGCASHKTLKNYQDEIRALREERTNLKKENRDLRGQLEGYEVALADANTRVTAPAESKAYPELDELGVDYGQRDGNFVISVPAEITFDSGKADLTKKGKEALRAVASTLAADYGSGN